MNTMRFVLFRFTIVACFVGACTIASAADLPQPRLHSPGDGANITDLASFFRWNPIDGCEQFDIEIARNSGFTNLYCQKRLKNVRYHENCDFPKEMLPVGSYFWRVRAVRDGAAGPWSEVRRVNVNGDHSIAKRPILELGPEHPLFILRNRHWDPGQTREHLR